MEVNIWFFIRYQISVIRYLVETGHNLRFATTSSFWIWSVIDYVTKCSCLKGMRYTEKILIAIVAFRYDIVCWVCYHNLSWSTIYSHRMVKSSKVLSMKNISIIAYLVFLEFITVTTPIDIQLWFSKLCFFPFKTLLINICFPL